jgi:dTDP-4-dehydrorhamnose 3,5-epimerase
MTITESDIPGAYLIDLEPIRDPRGFFARTFCAKTFADYGMTTTVRQCNLSLNTDRGTLRGMHYQDVPHQEAKLIRCTRGRFYDVCLDLRPDSPMFTQWVGVTLSAENRRALYVPEGCAHGFLTLENDTEIYYQISADYAPAAQRGVRYDDPAFGIEWPGEIRNVKPRDAAYPDFNADVFLGRMKREG